MGAVEMIIDDDVDDDDTNDNAYVTQIIKLENNHEKRVTIT